MSKNFNDIDNLAYAIAFDSLTGEMEKVKVELALAEDEEAAKVLETRLARLIALKNEEIKFKVKPIDIFNTVTAGVAGIAVLSYEQTGIITSKLWNMTAGAIFRKR
ncbi:MAG: hypothetical protein HXM02_06000 [[Eubacterium] sulci]|nr:hypothetical protein [[Eubacterium] sulci]